MSWGIGRAEIEALLAAKRLERVAPNREGAQAMLDAAATHLVTAEQVASTDPVGAYAVLYDAARKSLAALLLTQGLRPTSAGGHVAVLDATQAQFPKPPPSEAFRPYNRMRQTRNQGEYENTDMIDEDLVRDDLVAVRYLHEVASRLMPELPVFS